MPLHAQTIFVWTGSNTTWANAANWNLGSVPGGSDIARFNANTSKDPTIGSTPATIGRLEFRAGTDAETFGGTATLTINGVSGTGLTNDSGTTVIMNAGVALGGTQQWTVSGASSGLTLKNTIALGSTTLTLDVGTGATISTSTSGIFSGAGKLVKTGAGDLTLANVANTFQGGADLNGGTTTIANNASLGTGTITLGGGTLNATTDRAMTNALAVTASSTISGDSGTDFIFSSNSIAATAGTLSLLNTSGSGTMSLGFSGTGFTVSSAIATAANTELRFLNTSGTQTYSGIISGAGAVKQDGAGGTVILSAANSFAGALSIVDGTLKLGASGNSTNTPLGTAAGGTTVGSGATLDLAGYSIGTAESLTLSGTGVSGVGALVNTGGSATFGGAVTLAAATTIGGSGDITIVGTLSGANVLTKIGGGTLTLSSASSRNSNTIVNGGVLKLADPTAAGAITKNITLNGTTLDLATDTSVGAYPIIVSANTNGTILSDKASANSAGITHTLGDLTLNAGSTLTIDKGSNVSSGTATVQLGDVTLGTTGSSFIVKSGTQLTVGDISGNTRSFSVSDAGNMVVNGVIGTTTGNVTMDGTGTLTLNGANTYKGTTTINSGTVKFGSAGSGTNGPLGTTAAGTVVNSGGALDVNGFTSVTAEALSLAGAGGGTGALTNSSATGATYSGAITLTGATTIGGIGNLTLTAAMSGSGMALTKTGSSTLTFSGATSTVGATALDAGTLAVVTSTTLNTGALSSDASTTLILASGGTIVANYASGTTTFAGKIAPNVLDGVADTTGGGTFQKNGAGTLVFTNTFNAGDTSTLILNGGTLSLLGGKVTFGTIHITGNTVLDFNSSGGSSLSSASLIIDAGVTVTVNNWMSVAGNSAASTIWSVTNTVNGVALTGTDRSAAPMTQISFTNYTGFTTAWISAPSHNGWFTTKSAPRPSLRRMGRCFWPAPRAWSWCASNAAASPEALLLARRQARETVARNRRGADLLRASGRPPSRAHSRPTELCLRRSRSTHRTFRSGFAEGNHSGGFPSCSCKLQDISSIPLSKKPRW